MTDLLERALATQGGLERWNAITSIRAHLSSGGLLFTMKGQQRALEGIDARVETARQRTEITPFSGPGRKGFFEPERVWIETESGKLVCERRTPRAHFSKLRQAIAWDDLDVLYFAGYALWNYLCAPFFLTRPGFEVRELDAIRAGGGELQRRLEVTFPADVATHSRTQSFFFDERGMLLRLDYTAEPVGNWARAAHLCMDHRTFGGLLIPTRRRVVPRGPTGSPLPGPTLVWIAVDDVTTI